MIFLKLHVRLLIFIFLRNGIVSVELISIKGELEKLYRESRYIAINKAGI